MKADADTLGKWAPLLQRVPGDHVVQAATWVGPRD